MDSYKKAWKTIVQPPTCLYDTKKDLPNEFEFNNEIIHRQMF